MTILAEAEQLTLGARNADYGHPLEDFTRTALMWSAVLGVSVTAEQVGLCMVALKISRECNRPKRDNRVDMAGYAHTLDMIAERRATECTSQSEAGAGTSCESGSDLVLMDIAIPRTHLANASLSDNHSRASASLK